MHVKFPPSLGCALSPSENTSSVFIATPPFHFRVALQTEFHSAFPSWSRRLSALMDADDPLPENAHVPDFVGKTPGFPHDLLRRVTKDKLLHVIWQLQYSYYFVKRFKATYVMKSIINEPVTISFRQ